MITIELRDDELKAIILAHINSKLGDFEFNDDEVKFFVKSKQNYKAEWEQADFVATTDVNKYAPEVKIVAQKFKL